MRTLGTYILLCELYFSRGTLRDISLPPSLSRSMPIRNDLLIISRTRVNLQKTQVKVRGRLVVKNPLRCCATKWWRSEDIDRGRDSPDVMAASSDGRQCNRYTFYSESQSAKQRQTVPISPVELCNMKAYLMKQSYKTRTGSSILKPQKTRSSEIISYWTRPSGG